MARPKGKLFALLAVFAAIGLVAATGAFTTVQADRTVSVNVSDDSDALLGLEANDSSSNGGYVTTNNGEVVIDLDSPGVAGGGAGVNDNATTLINHTINVTNQGTQQVDLNQIGNVGQSGVDVYLIADQSANLSAGDSVTLGVGDTASLGLKIVTDSANSGGGNSFDATVTLEADAT